MVIDRSDLQPPSPRNIVVISCDGHKRVGEVIDDRWYRWRCTQKRCRHPDDPTGKKYRVFHIADLLNGRLFDTEFEDFDGRVIRPKGE